MAKFSSAVVSVQFRDLVATSRVVSIRTANIDYTKTKILWKNNQNLFNSSVVNLKLGEIFEYAIQLRDSYDLVVDDSSIKISLDIPGLTPIDYSFTTSIYDSFSKSY